MSVVEQGPVGTQTSTAKAVFTDRYEQFRDLGFTKLEAEKLANARTHTTTTDKHGRKVVWTSALHPSKVRKALRAGCGHYLAVRIFA